MSKNSRTPLTSTCMASLPGIRDRSARPRRLRIWNGYWTLGMKQEDRALDDRFHETSVMELMIGWWIPCFAIGKTRSRMMAGWRRVIELTMTDEEIERLTVLSRSRTEPASRVSRAQMLLAYRKNSSFCAVGQRVG